MQGHVSFPDFEDTLRQLVREEIALARPSEQPGGYFNVESAARYLDTTPAALRSLVKREQVGVHRNATGRLSFTREQLDEFAQGTTPCLTPDANGPTVTADTSNGGAALQGPPPGHGGTAPCR
jgi:hypothetical protein